MKWLHERDSLKAEVAQLKDLVERYESAAKNPGDDQRHRGVSVATQLVHCQHKREQAEAKVERLKRRIRILCGMAIDSRYGGEDNQEYIDFIGVVMSLQSGNENPIKQIEEDKDDAQAFDGDVPWCGECGAKMEIVRPGKYQCPKCD